MTQLQIAKRHPLKPTFGFNLKIRNGDLYIDEPITSGAMHTPRIRA